MKYFTANRWGEIKYPSTCISEFCGCCGVECLPCEDWPRLKEFKELKESGKIYCPDEIWSPNIYVVTNEPKK